MSDVYTDEQLLASAREHLFSGLMNMVAVSSDCPIKQGTIRQISGLLGGIDALLGMMTKEENRDAG